MVELLEDNVYAGIPVSSGIAIGRAYVRDHSATCILEVYLNSDDELSDEIKRLKDTLEKYRDDIDKLHDSAKELIDRDLPVSIFDTHVQIINDPSLERNLIDIIKCERCNAEVALQKLLRIYKNKFRRFSNDYFKDRFDDIKHVIVKLQRYLSGETLSTSFDSITDPVIIVAHDLSPADTIRLNPKKLIGFAIDSGGKTSHVGILASSMDTPAVVGLNNASGFIMTGDPVIVDGIKGQLIHKPTPDQFKKYNKIRQQWLYFDEYVHTEKDLDAITKDGIKINVLANIESNKDIDRVRSSGADGIGLFRTEYLFMGRSSFPSEEEQYQCYKELALYAGNSRSVLIRTLDIGGDKLLYDSSITDIQKEANPALGLRGIRYCLKNPDLFKTQIKAILRGAIHGNIKMMLPLITSIDELNLAKDIVAESVAELEADSKEYKKDIEIGLMIETPASVLISNELAKKASFFSIGTNDLIQFTLAIDRSNEQVAYLYDPLSLSILRSILNVIDAAKEEQIAVSVCGEIAQDPVSLMVLLGMGNIRTISMDTNSIAKIKKFIRSISIEEAEKFAGIALRAENSADIYQQLSSKINSNITTGTLSHLDS